MKTYRGEDVAFSRVLVAVAHPDDIESWCGGTVALLADGGAEVHYLLCTSGEKGSNDRAQTGASLARIREAEQRSAMVALGLVPERITFAGQPDGELEPSLALRRIITHAIRATQPDVVFTHDPAPPYRLHPDHRAVGRVALDAAFTSARDRLMFPELAAAGLEPYIVREAWLFATEAPNEWIDITATLARKVAARLAHVSQGADAVALPSDWQARAAKVGADVGLAYAESFHRVVLA